MALAAAGLVIAAAVTSVVYVVLLSPSDESQSSTRAGLPSSGESSTTILDAAFLDQSSAGSLDRLVSDSDLIVIGRVVDAQLVSQPRREVLTYACPSPEPLNEGKSCSGRREVEVGFYLTDYTIEVERYLKSDGRTATRLVVQEEGGMLEGTRIIAPGVPAYEQGKRYLLFLRKDTLKPGVIYTTAADLGAYELVGGQVDRLNDSYNKGAPLALEDLAEQQLDSAIQRPLSPPTAPD
jgi:hypothetical protein